MTQNQDKKSRLSQTHSSHSTDVIKSHFAKAILANNRGTYRMNNFQQAIRDDVDVKRQSYTMGLTRAQRHNQEMLKLMGEIKDASAGQAAIESRMNVS